MHKNNKSNKVIFLLLCIVLIFGAFLLYKMGIFNNIFLKDNNNNISEEQIETNETYIEEAENNETKEESKKEKDLNYLAEDEASFGELDVPVYKISEKNIKLPVLIYHAFSTPLPEGDVYKLFCTTDIFEDQITTLLNDGYTFITLEDMYKYKNGKIGLPEKNVTITMDDGWVGNYTEAFDIMKKYNVPATIFIVEELMETPGYLNWEQAKDMDQSGLVKIHVHGRKHVSATGYNKEKLIEDYNHTHALIEEKFGHKVQKIMAYPAGDSSADTIRWLKEAGFEVQVQTKYGTVNKSSKLDLTDLGRIRAERTPGSQILKTINASSSN